ncbi:permease-like cell division protein FtsX [Desulfolucanica intricata]|uniref:permease-like cell division protein FtsX n=1 Tax=Desulfolucanica intricata TaxID=1285191 RepID=UPI00082C927F|nr:permease-like cell division protein FtsX [Desulfolucanica intricata]
MRLNTIGYYFREAFFSLIRNRWLSLASVGTVTISLLILGSSLLLIINANHVAGSVEDTLEISVFLENKISSDRIKEIKKEINNIPGVSQAEFVSKEQALEDMKKDFGEQKDILEGLEKENNPLPDSFKVKTSTAQLVAPVSNALEKLPGVDQVRYGQGVVEKLLALTGWVRITGTVAMILLSAASVFLISTTIRLSVYARRREISIMKVLGATNWFVRLPFVLEGVVLGVFGAVLALTILHFSYYELVERMKFTLPFIRLVTEKQQILPYMGSLLVLGMLIGAVGSIIPMRKFLRV